MSHVPPSSRWVLVAVEEMPHERRLALGMLARDVFVVFIFAGGRQRAI